MAVSVYEARNEALKEILIGLTRLPITELEASHRRHLPAEIARWDFSKHNIVYAEVACSLPEEDAKPFIEQYATTTPIPGWKRIVRKISEH